MKKIDKLILGSFLGPFFLTFVVVVFILLNVQMLKYYDDFMGKGLGSGVIGQLFVYFAIVVSPTAFPLAVLLSSLMTFGNLGEHFELTAVKSAGVSLVRALLPIFVFVLFLTGVAFYSNNYLVPKAALEAYSLLYDIKQKKPALDLREGVFYNGIPDFSIRVNKKFPDGQTIGDVIIYDHREGGGNRNVTIADSGKMYTILNERYLKLELFDGHMFKEGSDAGNNTRSIDPLTRSKFSKSQFVLDLSSFALGKTDKSLFQSNRIMRNLSELSFDMDSIDRDMYDERVAIYRLSKGAFFYHMKYDSIEMPPHLKRHVEYRDSLKTLRDMRLTAQRDTVASESQNQPSVEQAQDTTVVAEAALSDTTAKATGILLTKTSDGSDKNGLERAKKTHRRQRVALEDSIPTSEDLKALLLGDSVPLASLQSALTLARQAKQRIFANQSRLDSLAYETIIFEIQWHKIISNSFACIMMFLIGAPLGSIIKRGGLGIPVLLSIMFFIIFYVISIGGEKWAKTGVISAMLGVWLANLVLLPIGLFFLRQARLDARLFDSDFYNVQLDKIKKWYRTKFPKNKQITT